jgi:hypothetical protein
VGDASPSTASASPSRANSDSLAWIGSITAARSVSERPSSSAAFSCFAFRASLTEASPPPLSRDGHRGAAQQRVGDAAHRGGDNGHLMSLTLQRADDVGGLAHC